MKTRFRSIAIAGFLAIFMAGAGLAEARVSMDKVLADKTFEVNKDALLLIDHEFGNVNIQNWDKNTISIKVTVHIESNSEEQAQKILSRIQLNISGDKSKVSSVCSLGNSSSNKTSFSIDLEVFMPKTINLQMKHKFGAAYIETVEGTAKIKSEYGSVKALSMLNPDTKVDVGFGSADIDKMTDGNLNISYSSLNLDNGGNIKIDSKYSDLELGNFLSGNFIVEGGSAEVKNIGSLILNSKFSSVEIGKVSGSLTAKTEYGSLEIDYVQAGFSTLDIINQFGGVEVGIDKSAGYEVSVQTSFGEFDYPESLAKFSNKFTSSTGSSYTGTIGQKSSGNSKLIAKTSYGNVSVTAE